MSAHRSAAPAASNSSAAERAQEQERDHVSAPATNGSTDIPRPKRIACVVCRRRKLRCDGKKPSCGTCARLGHDCAYDEVRRKSGPKRGYVKALEARLAQVETLLKDQGPTSDASQQRSSQLRQLQLAESAYGSQLLDPPLFGDGDSPMDGGYESMLHGHSQSASPHIHPHGSFDAHSPPLGDMPMQGHSLGDPMSDPSTAWEMMAMGLEEALPAPEVVDALHKIYFDKIHPSLPTIHKGRYYAQLDLAPNARPPVCLRYAMWTLAASVSDEYASMQTHFYRRSRKYIEEAEMKGHGENIISVAMSQAWTLIASYEFKLMYFPRAWMSTGRAVRLSQMMGLHRLDGQGLEVKQCIPAPKDWIEREERRRTFWAAFCLDRYASIGTGWPMNVEEKDILTNLPATDDAYDRGRPAKTLSLKEAMTADGAALISPFGGVVLMASLFGRNLVHLHRPDPDEKDDDLNGEFWRRHRHMDNILLNIALSLPSHFRLPIGINDPNIVFTNMNIHTSTICLHQAAIFKADKNRMPSSVSAESKIRCISAAAEIAKIMRMVCHLDLSGMNPFISFCLYVAARVFVQYLKSRPSDEQVRASLQFLLTAMGHLKKRNPLTESFLVQLDVDLTGSLDDPQTQRKFPYSLKKGVPEPAPPENGQLPSVPPPLQPSQKITELAPDGNQKPSSSTNPFPACPPMAASARGFTDNRVRDTPPVPDGGGGYPSNGVPEFHLQQHPSPQLSHGGSSTTGGAGQSPASISMDMGVDHGNTPSSSVSHATPPDHTGPGAHSGYTPMTYEEFTAGMHAMHPGGAPGVVETGYAVPKEVLESWDMLSMEQGYGGLEQVAGMAGGGFAGLASMSGNEFADFFAESTA